MSNYDITDTNFDLKNNFSDLSTMKNDELTFANVFAEGKIFKVSGDFNIDKQYFTNAYVPKGDNSAHDYDIHMREMSILRYFGLTLVMSGNQIGRGGNGNCLFEAFIDEYIDRGGSFTYNGLTSRKQDDLGPIDNEFVNSIRRPLADYIGLNYANLVFRGGDPVSNRRSFYALYNESFSPYAWNSMWTFQPLASQYNVNINCFVLASDIGHTVEYNNINTGNITRNTMYIVRIRSGDDRPTLNVLYNGKNHYIQIVQIPGDRNKEAYDTFLAKLNSIN